LLVWRFRIDPFSTYNTKKGVKLRRHPGLDPGSILVKGAGSSSKGQVTLRRSPYGPSESPSDRSFGTGMA